MTRPMVHPMVRWVFGISAMVLALTTTGCSSLLFKINATPANEIPDSLRPVTRNYRVPIDYRLLGQIPPETYQLDSGDILGIVVDGVLPYSPPSAPPPAFPVNFPAGESQLPPSTGFPVAVQQNGTIHLPGIPPLQARGLSTEELRNQIAIAYQNAGMAKAEKLYPIVTLIKARTYTVSVIRQDLGATGSSAVQLDAYRNDVLNALLKTGGLPGENAKDQVTILRNQYPPAMALSRDANSPPATVDVAPVSPSGDPMDQSCGCTIPLTQYSGEAPSLMMGDAILREGDIIYIENRTAEVFYTAGLLPGGQHQLPRDYDIDIFEAMAIAGYSYGKTGSTGGSGILSMTGITPTELYVFRKRHDGCEIAIKVDLKKAICDPRERLIVQSGDKLLLRYSPREEVANFSMFAIFTYGIRQLFMNN